MIGLEQHPDGLLAAGAQRNGFAHRELQLRCIARRVLAQHKFRLSHIDDHNGPLEPVGKTVHVRLVHEVGALEDLYEGADL